MKPNMLFFTKANFDNSKVVPGNFFFIYDSDDPNRTLGFQMQDKTVRWIPLLQESTNPSTSTTSETEVTDNGN
jgi:hypothetical protein